jgi:CubicO group peptidase (beta-lactamase class C family)
LENPAPRAAAPRPGRRRVHRSSLSLATALLSVAAPPCHAQQPPPAAAAVPPAGALRARLDAIEKAIDQKRRELHIPGAALVVVKDDRIVYIKGLGYKDRENRRPVTPDTLFAIGSSTKAFTAMTALMSQDENKLSLDDPPRKHLPFFRLRDPESDAKLTIRDLLSHRSGLNRTDLLWAGGALTTEELLRAAGAAKPTAKLGEKWQYQNVMFLAAGEAVARAQKMPYPEVVKRRIFAPLGMKASNLSVREMQRAPDHALGYEVNPDTKAVRRLPMRDLTAIAPAGAINSSARDMAQWVRLMLGNGAYGGKRLVSPRAVAEMTRKQIRVGPTMDYGLGWFLRDWNGHKVVEHGGNIDGFNALVALMPDQKLGFVLLTNVSGSPLGETAMETVWTEIVGKPEAPKTAAAAAPAAAPEPEAGTYLLKEANVNAEVVFKEGKLIFTVPGQPPYPLENVGGRRYKFGAPAPAGLFITFRPVKDAPEQTEAFLEQPQGNFVLSRVKAAGDRPPLSPPPVAAAGGRRDPGHPGHISSGRPEHAARRDQDRERHPDAPHPRHAASPVTLKRTTRSAARPSPEEATVTVRRDADGKVIGLTVKSPGGGFNATRTPAPLPEKPRPRSHSGRVAFRRRAARPDDRGRGRRGEPEKAPHPFHPDQRGRGGAGVDRRDQTLGRGAEPAYRGNAAPRPEREEAGGVRPRLVRRRFRRDRIQPVPGPAQDRRRPR